MSEEKETSEFQPEIDRAVRHIASRFKPFVVGLQDLDGLCRQIVEDMRAEGWRPPLAPPPDWKALRDRPPADPNDAYRKAREQLEQR
jgi:hypothetical protein